MANIDHQFEAMSTGMVLVRYYGDPELADAFGVGCTALFDVCRH
jgi:hypothetical protein